MNSTMHNPQLWQRFQVLKVKWVSFVEMHVLGIDSV